MVEAGVWVEEAMFIYQMNTNIEAEVGKTRTFTIEEAVRQETIFGTTLCGVATNKLDKMGNPDPLVFITKFSSKAQSM